MSVPEIPGTMCRGRAGPDRCWRLCFWVGPSKAVHAPRGRPAGLSRWITRSFFLKGVGGMVFRNSWGLFLIMGLSLVGSTVYASKGLVAPKHNLSVQVGFGYEATTGTSNTRNIDSRDRVRYARRLWRYTGRLSYNYAESGSLISANRLDINLKAARYFSGEKENFLLLALRYDRNPFDGYRYYQMESFGAGHRILRHGNMRLKVEAGIGYRQNYYLYGGSDNVPALRAALDYRWRVGRKSVFSQRVATLAARTGTLLTSTTSLSTPINGGLALKVSEIVDHYTSAPIGFKATSTFTTVNIIYGFT